MDFNNDRKFVYQSFSASYKLEKSVTTLCGCDYCLNNKFDTNKFEKQKKCLGFINAKNMSKNKNKNDQLKQTKSLENININQNEYQAEKNIYKKENNYLNYYDLWQSELFKSKAFEKDNEKLEYQVKYLEKKLEKETQQQIKISLEWRKTVMNLVDENKRLRMLINSHKTINQIN
jgi:hypothetical protein